MPLRRNRSWTDRLSQTNAGLRAPPTPQAKIDYETKRNEEIRRAIETNRRRIEYATERAAQLEQSITQLEMRLPAELRQVRDLRVLLTQKELRRLKVEEARGVLLALKKMDERFNRLISQVRRVEDGPPRFVKAETAPESAHRTDRPLELQLETSRLNVDFLNQSLTRERQLVADLERRESEIMGLLDAARKEWGRVLLETYLAREEKTRKAEQLGCETALKSLFENSLLLGRGP